MDLVVEDHSASAADQEDGAQHQADPSKVETGATAHSDNQAHGQLVPGQSGGMGTSAPPLIGLVGLLDLGRLLLRGLLGLLARLRLPHLPSIRPRLSVAIRHTRLLALDTRLLRLLLLASLPQKLRVPVALPQSPLLVVRQLQLSWASSLCYNGLASRFDNKKMN